VSLRQPLRATSATGICTRPSMLSWKRDCSTAQHSTAQHSTAQHSTRMPCEHSSQLFCAALLGGAKSSVAVSKLQIKWTHLI